MERSLWSCGCCSVKTRIDAKVKGLDLVPTGVDGQWRLWVRQTEGWSHHFPTQFSRLSLLFNILPRRLSKLTAVNVWHVPPKSSLINLFLLRLPNCASGKLKEHLIQGRKEIRQNMSRPRGQSSSWTGLFVNIHQKCYFDLICRPLLI